MGFLAGVSRHERNVVVEAMMRAVITVCITYLAEDDDAVAHLVLKAHT